MPEGHVSGALGPLTKSMKKAFWDARPRTWLETLHLAGTLIGIAAVVLIPLRLAEDLWATIAVTALVAMFVGALILLYVQDRHYARAQRLAHATFKLQEAFTQLRDASFARILHPKDHAEEVRQHLKEAVGALAETFSTATGVACRACIKQLRAEDMSRADPRQLQVFDLCRSDEATGTQSADSDYVSDNTDFEELFLGNQELFFSNDLRELSKKGQYKNSHWRADTIEKETYKYLSTMVWPIQKLLNDPASAPKIGAITPAKDLLGFLCVDALTPGVFNRETDFGIGAAFAAITYAVLKTGSPSPDVEEEES